MIVKLLDIEKDLRLAESFLSFCKVMGDNYPRNYNCVKDEVWFDLMEGYGFLSKGKFIPILEIIELSQYMSKVDAVFALECVGCDLSLIAASMQINGE
jgi:hypothetical protein